MLPYEVRAAVMCVNFHLTEIANSPFSSSVGWNKDLMLVNGDNEE